MSEEITIEAAQKLAKDSAELTALDLEISPLTAEQKHIVAQMVVTVNVGMLELWDVTAQRQAMKTIRRFCDDFEVVINKVYPQ